MSKHIDHLLPGYVAQQLPPQINDEVKRHIASCARCRASLEAYEHIQEDVRLSLEFAPVARDISPSIWATIDRERRDAPDRDILKHLVPRIVIGLLGILMIAGVPCFVYNGITLPFEAALQQVATEIDVETDMEIMTPKAPQESVIVLDDVRGTLNDSEQAEFVARGTIVIDTPEAKPAAATPVSTQGVYNVINSVP